MTTPTNSKPQPSALPLGDIRGYFLSKVRYALNTMADRDTPVLINVGVRVQKGQGPDVYQVTVMVQVKADPPEKPAPYDVEVEAVVLLGGMPEAHLDADQLIRHVALIAAPLGYGAIREELLNLSARGPFPRLVLPLVPARALVDSALSQDKAN